MMEWLINILAIAGFTLITAKKRVGFALMMVSNAGFITYFLFTQQWPFLIVPSWIFVTSVYGYWKWSK